MSLLSLGLQWHVAEIFFTASFLSISEVNLEVFFQLYIVSQYYLYVHEVNWVLTRTVLLQLSDCSLEEYDYFGTHLFNIYYFFWDVCHLRRKAGTNLTCPARYLWECLSNPGYWGIKTDQLFYQLRTLYEPKYQLVSWNVPTSTIAHLSQMLKVHLVS